MLTLCHDRRMHVHRADRTPYLVCTLLKFHTTQSPSPVLTAPLHPHLNCPFQPLLHLFGKPNPKVDNLIKRVKREAENSSCILMRSELIMEDKKRKTIYMKAVDQKQENPYQKDCNIRDCLNIVSYLKKGFFTNIENSGSCFL